MPQKNPALARFGAALARLRDDREWTDYRLAQEAGVGQIGLSRLIAGERDPQLSTLLRLADALGVTLDELVGRAGPAE
jgi:transcriptional regulator with XRE-family HTH domain